jgi:adenosylhomocysteine nucleosidase
MSKLGIVCGLAFEAEVVDRAIRKLEPGPTVLITCSGPGPERAREAATRLVEQGVDMLLSFGIACGLDPSMRTGAVIVASSLVGDNAPPCDGTWAVRLYEGLSSVFDVRRAPLAAARDVITTPADKAALLQATNAAAADMESDGIAEAAAVGGLPFASLRVVCDTAGETIPPVAATAMADNGRVRMATTILMVFVHPAQIPDLVRLGRRTAQAREVLEKLAGLGVPRLFFADR